MLETFSCVCYSSYQIYGLLHMKSHNIQYVQDTCSVLLIAGNNVIYLLHKAVVRAAFS